MIYVGTSGFNYPEWRGKFYPEDLSASRMLPFYASRFGTVEINYSFYRMPSRKLLEGWADQVPPGFAFSLKAPRRITHDRRLKDCADLVRGFTDVASALGGRLGVLLFQLAPNFKRDLGVLDAFLDQLPARARAAFEFRHASWWDDEVYDRLARRNLALCIADDEDRHTPFVPTADYGYLRLRDAGYDRAALREWADRVGGQASWQDAFVYFKHEDEARGPEFATAFLEARASA